MSGMQHTDGKEAEANEPHGEDKKVPAPPPVVEYMFNDRPQRTTENVVDRMQELPDEGYGSKNPSKSIWDMVGERSGAVSDLTQLASFDRYVASIHEDLSLGLQQIALVYSERGHKEMNLCKYISEIYLEFGRPQQALAVITEGISLAKNDNESHETRLSRGILYCLAAEAHEGLHQRRDAVRYYHLAREVDVDAKLEYRLQKLQLAMSGSGEDDGRTRITKTIGVSGGEIVLSDGAITFPMNVFPGQMVLHASTVDDTDNHPVDVVPISTTMKLTPNTNLKAAAEVILKTWAYPSDGEQAFVYFRESHTSSWKDPRPITLQEDGRAKFEIEKFCEYGIFIHVKAAIYWNFKIQACLFVNKDTKKISNRLTPKCETCADSLICKMAAVNFEPICTENPTLIVKVEDEVEVRLENIRDESGDKPAPPTKRAKITIDFLKDKSQGVQDFLLSRDCEGIVDFSHIVQLYRRDEAIGNPTTHDADSVNLDSQKPGGTYVSAGAFVTGHGRLGMYGGNLEAQQGAN